VRIMALDLANRSGYACGIAGEGKPRLEAWVLKKQGEPVERACRNLSCTLRDRIQLENPDLIVVENWLHPAASRNADSTITHLHLHGAVEGIAGIFGIPTVKPTSAQFRTHFCGQSTAAPRRKIARTDKQKNQDREATNRMVVKRAIVLGYLSHGSDDWDKASAAALWDWACATYARKIPKELVLFGEQPADAS
jgi:hypothetical protein